MPADHSLSQASTSRHGDASKPYPCYRWANPPGGQGFIDHGYCRTSLDALTGSTDSRCPKDCRHKAPPNVVVGYSKRFHWHGAQAAAKWSREVRHG